jgi:hypothetical protein
MHRHVGAGKTLLHSVAIPLARAVLTRPCPLMKPTISGRLAMWHGLSTMLRIPHTTDAATIT